MPSGLDRRGVEPSGVTEPGFCSCAELVLNPAGLRGRVLGRKDMSMCWELLGPTLLSCSCCCAEAPPAAAAAPGGLLNCRCEGRLCSEMPRDRLRVRSAASGTAWKAAAASAAAEGSCCPAAGPRGFPLEFRRERCPTLPAVS
jgi:hypothetical protein